MCGSDILSCEYAPTSGAMPRSAFASLVLQKLEYLLPVECLENAAVYAVANLCQSILTVP